MKGVLDFWELFYADDTLLLAASVDDLELLLLLRLAEDLNQARVNIPDGVIFLLDRDHGDTEPQGVGRHQQGVPPGLESVVERVPPMTGGLLVLIPAEVPVEANIAERAAGGGGGQTQPGLDRLE